MVVEYFHEIPGLGYGNIMWRGSFPMRAGKFPASHPAADGKMVEFRQRGYWASCFPEGDGITMKVEKGQDASTAAKDIAEVFGWTVDIKRA